MKYKKKYQSHFLDYTGKVTKKDIYFEFDMKDSTKIKSLNYFKAYNPTFDNLFKKVFGNENILISFLNDILFPKEHKIKKIQILNTNFNGPYGKYSIGSINLDMLCACFFNEETSKDNQNNDENKIKIITSNKKYDLVVDVEMQRVLKESPTERFIKYMSYVDAGILNEKILIIVLIIKNSSEELENNSAKINYVKKSVPKYKTLKEYHNHTIIEIDLNYCYNLIDKKKEIWIVDEKKTLTKKGKEWIKLLTMQIWCDHFNIEIYSLPNLEDMHFFQSEVKNALQILNVEIPFFSALIQQENEAMITYNKILELEKENEKKDKSLQEKDKSLQEKEEIIQKKKQ